MSDTEDPPRFEAVLGELETLVDRLESGELDLEEALTLYERGVHLTQAGNSLLQGAERRVHELQRSLSETPR
jgi:exodeoxyribonuclease VII small subunit